MPKVKRNVSEKVTHVKDMSLNPKSTNHKKSATSEKKNRKNKRKEFNLKTH